MKRMRTLPARKRDHQSPDTRSAAIPICFLFVAMDERYARAVFLRYLPNMFFPPQIAQRRKQRA
jgi:hypothetical protein